MEFKPNVIPYHPKKAATSQKPYTLPPGGQWVKARGR